MRGALLLLISAAYGCDTAPITICRSDADHDCCTSDRFCENTFGSEFPYCVNPGLHTGVCSECARDSHCRRGEVCEIDRGDLGACVER